MTKTAKQLEQEIAELSLDMNIKSIGLKNIRNKDERKKLKAELKIQVGKIIDLYKELAKLNNEYGFKAKFRVLKLKAIQKAL